MSVEAKNTTIFNMVSSKEDEQQLKSVKRNKATGLDHLQTGLIKDAAELISAPLAHFVAKVIPIYKSGAQSNPDNYRPILVLPVISKLIKQIIHRQLITFLDKNHLLTKFQFGFRPELSTEYAATILLDNIRNNVDKGKLVGAIFVDLSKDFDTKSHNVAR